ncbi:hypothetical protein J5N97_029343 [Dioscorea zingiberensis]|uniref:Pectinesterase inhibitor domain-containing protein n=1 Tax=Dioscorea zingiberensis TaxID=325984 RepID=A0A9D5C048_9LILI|nr:hypothetical protein J5N97_029343 [Dioscorea zingiberensis]
MKSILLLLLLFIASGELIISSTATPTDFIRTSCNATRYPTLCIQSLSSYATAVRRDPRQLARAALNVSAEHARAASAFVSRVAANGSKSLKGREAGAVKDCVENMADSEEQLRRSVKEMGRMGSGEFAWHVSNVQTWVSAALTDVNTCMDGLGKGKKKKKEYYSDDVGVVGIRKKVVVVAQTISNALALVNRMASLNN